MNTIVVGASVKDLIKIDKVENVVTKYDENTGKPYEKVTYRRSLYFLGKLMPEESPYEFETTKEIEDLKTGMFVFVLNDSGADYSKSVYGYEIARTHSDINCLSVVDLTLLNEKVKQAKEVFNNLGFPDASVRLFMVQNVG